MLFWDVRTAGSNTPGRMTGCEPQQFGPVWVYMGERHQLMKQLNSQPQSGLCEPWNDTILHVFIAYFIYLSQKDFYILLTAMETDSTLIPRFTEKTVKAPVHLWIKPQFMRVWEMTPLASTASYWTRNIAAKVIIQQTRSNGQINEQFPRAHTICLFAFPYSGPDLASIKKDGNTPDAFGGSKCLLLYTPASWGVYIVGCIQATCLYVFPMQFQFL